jgi:hypothetical protein
MLAAAHSDTVAIIALIVAGISAIAAIFGVIVARQANTQSRRALAWQQVRDSERGMTKVAVRVHKAFLRETPVYCVDILNASPEREVTVTHVSFATDPAVPVIKEKLPVRIAPVDQWETWIEADKLPDSRKATETLARAVLADGTVVCSTARDDVPEVGLVSRYATGNDQLVERVGRAAAEFARAVATPNEARTLLGRDQALRT